MNDGAKRCGCGRGCRTFGACLRGKRLHVLDAGQRGITTAWDGHLDRYEWAVRQGIQPASTLKEETDFAIAVSEATGEPFRAD
jgi:hypothetical protein